MKMGRAANWRLINNFIQIEIYNFIALIRYELADICY